MTPWEFGGETTLHNMVLLCLAHHQILHHSQWSIQMLDGVPHFVPPAYIDPTQTPIRHTRYSMRCQEPVKIGRRLWCGVSLRGREHESAGHEVVDTS
ncbi:hypothetical protein [Fodinicola acaciae]|uniref:hypothetical protein n=1 Tax=Fodinicola acaciae TaxID=2681555 RepID=UPI0013D10A74|nr:hypothetical protein [Fodinicola acaciae]